MKKEARLFTNVPFYRICLSVGVIFPVLIAILFPNIAYAQEPETLPHFEKIECPFFVPLDEIMECGYLSVPENRSRPNGRIIRLGVTIVKSHIPTPKADPIIYINGGPGGVSKDVINDLSRYDAWLAKRDLILLDQRGLGWSEPALKCPEIKDVLIAHRTGANISLEERLAPRLACRDRWLAEGIDLSAYNYHEIAADIADLWQALDLEHVNLYSISAGTIPAQIILRDYGHTGHLRSVILDAAVPLSTLAMADSIINTAESMAKLFARCEADFLCRTAYPDLEKTYLQVIEQLEHSPVMLPAINPLTNEPFTFQFDIADFGYTIMYRANNTFPAYIYDVYDNNYAAEIHAREEWLRESKTREAGGDFGLRTSIACHEPWYSISPAQQATLDAYPEANFLDDPLQDALCEQWPSFESSDISPVISDVPTLILVGEYDTRLAPYDDLSAKDLSRGYYYLVPTAPHNVLQQGGACPNLMALSFLDDPSTPPDSTCLASMGTSFFDTEFVIRRAAGRWPTWGLVSVLSLFLVGAVGMGSLNIRRYRTFGLGFSLAWRNNLRQLGVSSVGISVILVILSIYGTQNNHLPFMPTQAIAIILPLIVAIQAAFLLSPEDEPILEIMLAAPRPLAWTLLDRLSTLFIVQTALGFGASLYLRFITGQSMAISVLSWLPLLFFFSGIAIIITLSTRRAVFAILLISLIWLLLTLFGDFLFQRWPIIWPFDLYLESYYAEYYLNRLFITLLGLSLIAFATLTLLNNPERLLLGSQKTKKQSKIPNTPKTVLSPDTKITVAQMDSNSPLTKLSQMMGIIRYELLLQWRQNTLPALLIGMLITPVLGVFVARSSFQGYTEAIANGTLPLNVAKADITAEMVSIMWIGISLLAFFMVPLLVANTIPKDKQIGMRELLDTLPLSFGTYLGGKLLSVWVNLSTVLAIAAFVSGVVWWIIIGPFEVSTIVDIWFVGALALILINASSSLLLAARQVTNRRAMLWGGVYILLCLVGLAFAFGATESVWQLFNPGRPLLMLYYGLGFSNLAEGNDELSRAIMTFIHQVASRERVLWSLAAGFLQVGVIFGGIWYLESSNKRGEE